MAVTYKSYSDPGVYITQTNNPTVTTQVTLNPTVVCLVGPAQYLGQTIVESFVNNATSSVNGTYVLGSSGNSQPPPVLSSSPPPPPPGSLGINSASIISIANQDGSLAYPSSPPAGSGNGLYYVAGTDYTLTVNSSTDGTPQDTTGTVTIVATGSNGNIQPGTKLKVTYMAAAGDYYQVFSFQNANDVFNVYGQPFFTQKQISQAGGPSPTPFGPYVNSPLSLAAWFAFLNGANQVLTLAVLPSGNVSAAPSEQDWVNAFQFLLNETDIDIIVPVSGDPTVIQNCFNLVQQQVNNGFFMRGFYGPGYDPTGPYSTVSSSPSYTTIINMATNNGYAYGESTKSSIFTPPYANFNSAQAGGFAGVIPIGACYLAAAAAGRSAAQAGPWVPITHKQLVGGITIPNQLNAQTIVQEQANGVCVVYQNRQGNVLVKHGLTTDMSSWMTQEISIQATIDKLFDFIMLTVDSQDLIGGPFTQTTPNAVLAAISTALTTAQSVGMIYGFSGLQYSVPNPNPTTVLVSFTYQPTLPLNYIQVQMSIDANAGTTTFQANPLTSSNASNG